MYIMLEFRKGSRPKTSLFLPKDRFSIPSRAQQTVMKFNQPTVWKCECKVNRTHQLGRVNSDDHSDQPKSDFKVFEDPLTNLEVVTSQFRLSYLSKTIETEMNSSTITARSESIDVVKSTCTNVHDIETNEDSKTLIIDSGGLNIDKSINSSIPADVYNDKDLESSEFCTTWYILNHILQGFKDCKIGGSSVYNLLLK